MIRIERVHPVNIVELVMTNAELDITQVTEALEEDIAVQKAQATALLMMTLQATAQVTVRVQMIVSTIPPTATFHLKDVVLNRLVDIIEKGNHHQINIFIKTFIVNPMDKRDSHLKGIDIQKVVGIVKKANIQIGIVINIMINLITDKRNIG